MIKRALIIAPHPDDEINLAGQLMVYLVKNNVEIFVMYTTNGDAEKKIDNKRILEAVNANSVLGIDANHVIFLGYPNEWSSTTHIYNANDDEKLLSKLGKKVTNAISDHPEFCFLHHGVHRNFTRRNFKDDYKETIQIYLPDLIIAPEFDSHPDHRATSLLFDEIMGEILKENYGYRPFVLKKYIHEGVWYGPKDYYQMLETKTDGKRNYSGGAHDLDSPCFFWGERIRYKADSDTCTELLSKNIVYKAAKKHKVTTAWYEMQRVLNSDIVYWNRRTDNLSIYANIIASSGCTKYLNDFMLYNTLDVSSISEPFADSQSFCWQPDMGDNEKRFVINFRKLTDIRRVVIYEDCNYENHIKSLKIKSDNREVIIEPDNSGAATVIEFENRNTSKIEVQVLEWIGIPGISEIEVYSDVDIIPFEELLEISSDRDSSSLSIIQRIEKILFMFRFLFVFKLKYELKRKIERMRIFWGGE